MNHTPGPWELWTSNSWRRITSRATGSTVCEPVTQRDGHPDLYFRNGGEDGPDAHLIASAPDLLAALRHVHFCGPCSMDSWADCEGGRAALAVLALIDKAEGR